MPDDRNLASDMQSYYSRLNNIRSKFGLGAVNVPDFIPNKTVVLSEQIKSYDNHMTDTANQRLQYISKNLPTGNLDVGEPTLRSTDLNIKQMLNTWESTCYHRSDYRNYSDDGDHGDCGDKTNYSDNDKHENERFNDEGYRAVCASVYQYKTDN